MKFKRNMYYGMAVVSGLLLMLNSCEKEALDENQTTNEMRISEKVPSRVEVCHYSQTDDSWDVISINENSLQAHLNHGDVQLIDFDGDGFVEELNECVPGGDCDDTDVTIYPGSTEICGNGVDDNCNGEIDEDCAEIGDFRDGGVVFWIDPDNPSHGLVCAIEDQSPPTVPWYNGSLFGTGATDTAIGAGSSNTDIIINAQGPIETSYAAGLARAYTGGGFTDWFLPSKDALNEMYANEAIINSTATANGGSDFINYYYWSSSEGTNSTAWEQDFTYGYQTSNTKANPTNVRAVRAF